MNDKRYKNNDLTDEEFSMFDYIAGKYVTATWWMEFVATCSVITAILAALTIVGLIFAWIPLLAGLFLYKASSRIKQAIKDRDVNKLAESFIYLRKYFLWTAVVIILTVLAQVALAVIPALSPRDNSPRNITINVEGLSNSKTVQEEE